MDKPEQSPPQCLLPLEMLLVRPHPCWKRALDLATVVTAVLLLAPLLLATALLIKLVSPGPVFFSQARIGQGGQPFRFWKFRTMHVGAQNTTHQQHLHKLIHSDQPLTKLDTGHDPRIIRMGWLLRAACIDELPQLFNVIKGDMSIVGPRPCLPYEACELANWQRGRFEVRPGMTGLWQVSGKNKTSFLQMLRYDLNYAGNASFWLDSKIIAATIPTVWEIVRSESPTKSSPTNKPQGESACEMDN